MSLPSTSKTFEILASEILSEFSGDPSLILNPIDNEDNEEASENQPEEQEQEQEQEQDNDNEDNDDEKKLKITKRSESEIFREIHRLSYTVQVVRVIQTINYDNEY
jgi:hypothetical protein